MGDIALRLLGRSSDMGCDDCVWDPLKFRGELLAIALGFNRIDIDRSASELCAPQALAQRLDINDRTAAQVEEHRALFHRLELLLPDKIAVLRIPIDVYRHHIGFL